MAADFTLIEADRTAQVPASLANGRVWLSATGVRDALGWELKPQGLCRGERCVPVRDPSDFANAKGIDLELLAATLGQPLALDADERVAALGAPVAERAASLASLEAPDFRLPDLAGRMHALSEQRGKKVLLIAYASW